MAFKWRRVSIAVTIWVHWESKLGKLAKTEAATLSALLLPAKLQRSAGHSALVGLLWEQTFWMPKHKDLLRLTTTESWLSKSWFETLPLHSTCGLRQAYTANRWTCWLSIQTQKGIPNRKPVLNASMAARNSALLMDCQGPRKRSPATGWKDHRSSLVATVNPQLHRRVNRSWGCTHDPSVKKCKHEALEGMSGNKSNFRDSSVRKAVQKTSYSSGRANQPWLWVAGGMLRRMSRASAGTRARTSDKASQCQRRWVTESGRPQSLHNPSSSSWRWTRWSAVKKVPLRARRIKALSLASVGKASVVNCALIKWMPWSDFLWLTSEVTCFCQSVRRRALSACSGQAQRSTERPSKLTKCPWGSHSQPMARRRKRRTLQGPTEARRRRGWKLNVVSIGILWSGFIYCLAMCTVAAKA